MKATRKPRKIICSWMAGFLLVSLSACSSSASDGLESYYLSEDLKLCTRETDSGFFTIQSFNKGYSTICYTDYVGKKQLVLCDVPNCAHDSDSCKSYIKLNDDDFPPLILSTSEKILLVYSSSSSKDMAHIDMMDLNGNNKELLVRLDKGESILGGIYASGDFIYFEKWFVENTENGPTNRSAVYKVNSKTKESALISLLPSGYAICGTSGFNYIISHYSQENAESFYTLSPANESNEWALSSSPFYESSLTECGAMILSGNIVEYYPKNYLLKISDIDSGETVEIDCSKEVFPYDSNWIPDISKVYGACTDIHYLQLTDSIETSAGNRTILQKIIDTSNRVFSPNIVLKDEFGKEMLPVGEYQDYFCVITGYENLDKSSTTDSGDFLISSFNVPKYALILKSDYFSQTDNLIPIENLF